MTREEQTQVFRELIQSLPDEDAAHWLRAMTYVANRPKNEPLVIKQLQELFERLKYLQ